MNKTNNPAKQTNKLNKQTRLTNQTNKQISIPNTKQTNKKKQGDAGGCGQTYWPERPKDAKDEARGPFCPSHTILYSVHNSNV